MPSAPGIWGEIYYRLHKLAKQWHAQVRQVEQQHSRFIQAIQASPNGVAMLDDHDQIEWCNAIAEVHFGLDAKRDLRQHITNLVRHPEFVRYLNAQHYEETLVMRGMGDSRQNVLEVQVFPYGENRKLLLTQDITGSSGPTRCGDFVANVSHELKTPLTVLSGFLETMRELPLNEEDRARYLDMMEQQASRMRHIVTDLLVLAKLEGESKPPLDRAIDMRAVFDHLKEDAQTLSNGHHDIAFSIDETLGVTGAQTELFSAFANLVTNAIRYTPEGGKIVVTWRREGAQGVFSVTDSGFGIPAADLPRLTERFYRVDRSRSRDTGGTGPALRSSSTCCSGMTRICTCRARKGAAARSPRVSRASSRSGRPLTRHDRVTVSVARSVSGGKPAPHKTQPVGCVLLGATRRATCAARPILQEQNFASNPSCALRIVLPARRRR